MKWLFFILIIILSSSGKAQVTYHEHIAPILEKNCLSCHQENDIGPIPFTSYDDVASYASMIQFVTDTKLMPPFKADYHKVQFANERSISDEERDLIAQWIDEGLLEGKSLKAKSKKQESSNSDYDYTICMAEKFEHYGIYYDQYQVFPLELDLASDKYISDIFFEPGNKKIVRSANISLAPKGKSSKLDTWDPRYGFFAYGSLGFNSSYPNWYSWMPNTTSTRLSENEHLYLPNDSELLLHIHYGPYGEIQTDSSCVHFNFAEKQKSVLQNVPFAHIALMADTFLLEGGLKKRISSSIELPVDVSLRSITPLAHLLCRSWEVFAVLPDRSSVSILSIDDWDFHWREKYIFKEALNLPKGTKIYSTATYDNTSSNPYNPSDPPHTMKAGPHMFDENYVCYFEVNSLTTSVMITKPFTVTEDIVRELNFTILNPGEYTIQSFELSSGNQHAIGQNYYSIGNHSLQSSKLPKNKGVHIISILDKDIVLDSWWIVKL